MNLFAGDCYPRKTCALLHQTPTEDLQFRPPRPRLISVVGTIITHHSFPRQERCSHYSSRGTYFVQLQMN